MEKSRDQELLKLQQKIRLLERKNNRLEKEFELKDMKAGFFDMMTDIAAKGIQYRHTKKLLSRTVNQYKEEKSVSISEICRLIGISRLKYYRQQWNISRGRQRTTEVVGMVRNIRMEPPHIGTRKLYHMLH